jgi:probable HAF family extracellular repeat protein
MRLISFRIGRASIAVALSFAFVAQARAQSYPYTLVDPGTFGGPQSFFNGAIPLTPSGVLVGSADTTIPDADFPTANPGLPPDPVLFHAFAWRSRKLENLGALAGNDSSMVSEMNGNGLGVGASETSVLDPYTGSPSLHAVIFHDGQVQDLGTLPGGTESIAGAVNDAGQVTGFSLSGPPDLFSQFVGFVMGSPLQTFIWQHGVMRDIGTLGGPDAFGSGLNARGQIAGISPTESTPNPSTGLPTIHPFLWQNGHMRDLGTLGGTLAMTTGMNNRGEVIGESGLTGDNTVAPFLWNGKKMIDLGSFGGGFGETHWINHRGDVAGDSFTTSATFDGFLWRNGRLIDLPPLPGTVNAFPQSVNDRDQVVGETDDANYNPIIAALWVGDRTYDLNTLIAPSSLHLVSAGYINNRGDIVGWGLLPDGSQREFLLTRNPSVPLPTTSTAARRPRIPLQTRRPGFGVGPPRLGSLNGFAMIAVHRLLNRTR